MARYKTQKLLQAHPSQIEKIAEAIRTEFTNDGFEVMVDDLMSGGKDISITKGNMFKAVLGMKSALKVVLTPQSNGVMFDANVGIYGQQAIPTGVSWSNPNLTTEPSLSPRVPSARRQLPPQPLPFIRTCPPSSAPTAAPKLTKQPNSALTAALN